MQSGPDRSSAAVRHRFDITVEGVGQGVRTALSELIHWLTARDLSVEETGTVQLVLAEILNNIIEHAYAPDTPFDPIQIAAALKEDGLHLAIHDRGKPMPDGKLPIGTQPSIDVEMAELPEGGFGWFLIQHLARDVVYRRVGAENHLRLRINVGPGPLN